MAPAARKPSKTPPISNHPATGKNTKAKSAGRAPLSQSITTSTDVVVQERGPREEVVVCNGAEEALRESEERLRLAQQAARIGTFEWNIRTGVNTWTPELEAMYGLTPGAFARTASAWESLVHPDDRRETVRLVERAFETAKPIEGEWRVVWPDGSLHWLTGRWQVFTDTTGKPLRMIGVNIDITERKQTEEQLKQLTAELEQRVAERTRELVLMRDRYAELYNFSPAGHLTLDHEGVIQEVNLRASVLLGIPQGEMIHQPLSRFVEPGEQIAFARHCEDIFKTGERQSCDLRFRHPGGTPMVLHLESHAFCDDTGILTRCRTALFDITEQRRIGQEHDRLAASWRLLLDSTGEGIYGIDRQGRCTFINKAGAKMFGYQPHELLGRLMHELVHHHRPDRTPYPIEECLVYNACRTRQGLHVEDEVFWRSDGTAFPVAYSSYPLIEEGGITGAVVVFTDMSERKREEKQFQALLESAPDAHVIVDQTGRIVVVNNQTEKFFGYSRHELLGQSIEILVPQRFRGKHEGHRAGFMANPRARAMGAGIELYARRKDGSEFPTEISLNSLESDQGLLVTAAIRDITERKQAEKALWESELRFRELVDLFPIAVYVCNPSGVITQCNRHCTAIWGREPRCGDPQERFNGAHKMFLPDGTPLRHEDAPISQVLRSGIPQRNKELVFERPDGSRITVLVNPIPLWNQAGEIIGAVNCMLDITDRKKMEEQLQDTLDRIRTLSQRLDVVREEERRHISRELHDDLGIRLTCLKLDLARLKTLVRGSVSPREKIEQKIMSMTDHVDRTIAEIQRLVAELRPGVLDDLGLVAAIEWQCQDFERRSGIRSVFETTQEEINLDPSCATAAFRICQEALTNVVRHAKATAVGVCLEQVDRHLVLKISDNGIGISPDKLSDSRSFGLMIMRERADALSGQVRFGVEPGRGTTVTVRLPLSCDVRCEPSEVEVREKA